MFIDDGVGDGGGAGSAQRDFSGVVSVVRVMCSDDGVGEGGGAGSAQSDFSGVVGVVVVSLSEIGGSVGSAHMSLSGVVRSVCGLGKGGVVVVVAV